jgi:hypothetical protein
MKALAIASVLLMLVACNKTDSQATPAGSSSTTAASATPSAAPVAAADIPSEEDFEDEAEKDITPDTLEAQLASMEKEIDTN